MIIKFPIHELFFFFPFLLININEKYTMQLSFQRPILHQFINKEPRLTMNTITHKFYDILMAHLAQPTHFILQLIATTKGEFNKGKYHIPGNTCSSLILKDHHLKFSISITICFLHSCLEMLIKISSVNDSRTTLSHNTACAKAVRGSL